jgi:hypothetical protein
LRIAEIMREPSRFAGWPSWLSAATLAFCAALLLWGALHAPSRGALVDPPVTALKHSGGPADPGGLDIMLYRAMADGVRQGGDYYGVTAHLLRENDYPLRPFVAFRLPTLTLFLAHVPHLVALVLMAALLAAVILAWTARLAPAFRQPEACSYASLLIMMNALAMFNPGVIVFHEGWSALLVALSLVSYRPGRWGLSMLLALIAVLIRELALPYVLLMGTLALLGKQWREAAAWFLVVAIFAAAMALHAEHVWAVTSAADPASPGWTAAGGLSFLALAVQKSSALNLSPWPIAQWLVPFALLGWAGLRCPTGLRVFLYLTGFCGALMLFGRPDNFYWAAMITPLLFVGLLFAPAALADLVRSVCSGLVPIRDSLLGAHAGRS